MNKIGTEVWEEQDEELYALLEKAMTNEPRLTVSEELIQKTLKRVEESSAESGQKEKRYKKFYRPLRYAGMAAAAVLVLAVGVTTFGNGNLFVKDEAQMEAESSKSSAPYNMASASDAVKNGAGESESAAIMYRYVCTQESDAVAGTRNEVAQDAMSSADSRSDDAYGQWWSEMSEIEVVTEISGAELADGAYDFEEGTASGTEVHVCAETIAVSEELAAALDRLGYTVSEQDARLWNFASEQEDREIQVIERLQKIGEEGAGDQANSKGLYFDEDGGLMSQSSLQLAIQVQTEQGELWIVLEEEVHLLLK